MTDKTRSWPVVPDTHLIHEWVCPRCGVGAVVGPSWYANNGTPTCEQCDEDMEYARTRIKPVRATVHVRGGVAYEPARVPRYVRLVIKDHDNEEHG